MADIANNTIPDIIKFIKQKDYKFIKELGQGACGKTILIKDETIDDQFVCKKYLPFDEKYRESLYKRFLDEIKILYKLNHKNIVRIFNYYMYPDFYSGYILMEYIDGVTIDTYVKQHPEMINSIFEQTIEAFTYLEQNKILHRDIRFPNIMITNSGEVKVIDFGFSKIVQKQEDNEKSISLNWWCELPNDFAMGIYDFKTEIYFIGKLFEKLVTENQIDNFAYKEYINLMIKQNYYEREESFRIIQNAMRNKLFMEMKFSEQERGFYLLFATALSNSISTIAENCNYENDAEKTIMELEKTYRKNMLEHYVQKNNTVASCFLLGGYRYKIDKKFEVDVLKNFIDFLKSSSVDKRNIILANISSRLDSITRYVIPDDDIPF